MSLWFLSPSDRVPSGDYRSTGIFHIAIRTKLYARVITCPRGLEMEAPDRSWPRKLNQTWAMLNIPVDSERTHQALSEKCRVYGSYLLPDVVLLRSKRLTTLSLTICDNNNNNKDTARLRLPRQGQYVLLSNYCYNTCFETISYTKYRHFRLDVRNSGTAVLPRSTKARCRTAVPVDP